jgi:glycosyltransferase involved in cell wall biosynthesis
LERFPEYDRKVSEYLEYDVDPVEKFSILRRKHRPAILFDLFHLPAKYSGTSELALNLLREVHTLMEKDCDLYVGVTEEGRFFASELNGYRLFEERPGSEMLFDLVFKPSQFFRWSEFRRMNRLAPRLSFVLLDIIAVRCDYLSSVQRTTMFEKTVALADQVYTLSHFSRSDFQAYFGTECPAHVIHLGTDSGLGSAEAIRGEYVLVVGNSYAHKGIKDALPYLTEVGPVRVMGGEKPAENSASHIRWMASGAVTRGSMRELYAKASVLVYPSLYEGYGLPIVDALAVGKPVVAIDSEVNRELAAALNTASFTLVPSFRDLKEVVANKVRESADNPPDAPVRIRRWRDVAEEYVASFRELLERPPNIRKLRDRHDLIRVLNAARHP